MKKSIFAALLGVILVFFSSTPSFAHSLDPAELKAYLADVELTEEEVAWHLEDWYDLDFDYFESVEELADFLGSRLTEEDINDILNELSAYYDLSRADADAIIAEYIPQPYTDLLFYSTFYIYVDMILYFETEPYYPNFEGFLTEFSLTYEEEAALYDHFWSVRQANPQLSSDLDDLKARSMQFDGFESIRELSAADVAELFAIGEKALDVLDLHPQFYLDRVGEDKKPIDYKTLMSGEAIKGYDLLIELYNAEGTFLADFYITAEMFNSHFVKTVVDDVNKIGKKIDEKKEKPESNIIKPVEKTDKTSTTSSKVTKTVDGAKMPVTASTDPLYALLGLGLMTAGVLVFRRLLKKEAA